MLGLDDGEFEGLDDGGADGEALGLTEGAAEGDSVGDEVGRLSSSSLTKIVSRQSLSDSTVTVASNEGVPHSEMSVVSRMQMVSPASKSCMPMTKSKSPPSKFKLISVTLIGTVDSLVVQTSKSISVKQFSSSPLAQLKPEKSKPPNFSVSSIPPTEQPVWKTTLWYWSEVMLSVTEKVNSLARQSPPLERVIKSPTKTTSSKRFPTCTRTVSGLLGPSIQMMLSSPGGRKPQSSPVY